MGSGRFDSVVYSNATTSRLNSGISDFEYSRTATVIHPNLDPHRINGKPFGKLESRDSDEHPESNAILVCLDVTGSNYQRAFEAQKKLPNLMALLERYLPDPQVAIAANDDFTVEPDKCAQISDFESDNRIDEHIRNLVLTNNGGGNHGESYDLLIYAAANKTILDCFEKRQRKGYFFMYADEPIFTTTSPEHARHVFGDGIARSIPIERTIALLKEKYHVFVMWPAGSSFPDAREQYVRLFGSECVVTLQHPNLICEVIGGLIGATEGRLNSEEDAVNDMVLAGVSHGEAVAASRLIWGHGARRIHTPPAASA
jgi:hypothetical protein